MRTNGPLQLFPLLRIAVALAAGIAVGHGCCLGMPQGLLLCAFVVLAAATALTLRWQIVQGGLLLAASFVLGVFVTVRHEDRLQVSFDDTEVKTQAVLLSEPQQRGKVMRADIRVVGGKYDGLRVKAAFIRDTVTNRHAKLHLGSGIGVTLRPEPPRGFGTGNFDYPLYLRCRGFTATALIGPDAWHADSVSLAGWSHLDRVRLAALRLRQGLMQRYLDLGMGDDEAAVAVAMTLGDRSRLTNDLRDLYSISGASHVLALSGMHLGIIYLLLSAVLGFGGRYLLRELLIIIGIWAYVFLTGFSPSAVRSAVMITVYSAASVINRDRMSLNALALTAIIMLLANPLLLYDVGFEMSFMAVLAILLIYPRAYHLVGRGWLERHRVAAWAWALLVLSCCAQLGVAPLTAYYFGRFSVYFLLTNFIVIPLATVLLYVSVAIMLSLAWPALAMPLAKVLSFVVMLQNAAVAWISALPCSHVENLSPTRLQVLLAYVVIAAMLVFAGRLTSLMRNKS